MLRALPELPDPNPNPLPQPAPERYVRTCIGPDGWGRGEWSLPPEEHALVMAGLTAGRDAEFKDRNDLPADAEVTGGQAATVS